jgi:hypothetical protein
MHHPRNHQHHYHLSMTDPINLTHNLNDLRKMESRIRRQVMANDEAALAADAWLALIDTAEAAKALMDKPTFHWQDDATTRLRETLNRYTTTP